MPWTPSLAIGVAHIDEQHKTLFEKAEKLFEAGRNKESQQYIGELLRFLDRYTKDHFAEEEKFMIKINYPEYAEHKKVHTAFIAQLAELTKEYKTSGGNLMVILNANKMVVEWLTKHISGMDKKIGIYAREHQ